jgi:hypothetical protein
MPHCENPLCNDLVDRHRPHHKMGDAYFCGAECAKAWVDVNERLLHVARRFLDQPVRQSSSLRLAWFVPAPAREPAKVAP